MSSDAIGRRFRPSEHYLSTFRDQVMGGCLNLVSSDEVISVHQVSRRRVIRLMSELHGG